MMAHNSSYMNNFYKRFLLLAVAVLLLYSEGSSQLNFIRLAYTKDYLQGDQVELSVGKRIRELPISFEAGTARTPDLKSYNVKTGIYYHPNFSEVADISFGVRGVYAFFIEEISKDRNIATYLDFPIKVDFKIYSNFSLGFSFIPTYNTFILLNEKVVFQSNVGISYNF